MKRSTNRFLTTHVGSIQMSPDMFNMVLANEQGKPIDREAFAIGMRKAVADVVKKQVEVGLDVVNDGEHSKTNFSTYTRARLHGFDGGPVTRQETLDQQEFPDYVARRRQQQQPQYACNGPVSWKDFSLTQLDIENLKAGAKGQKTEDVFLTSISPGTLSNSFPNQYYPTEEAYLYALADVMKREYDAIAKAGFILQLDSTDLSGGLGRRSADVDKKQMRKDVALRMEVFNYATRDVPSEQLRLHICWGRTEGPKHHDVPLGDIADLVIKGKHQALSTAGANGRHEWEWKVWQDRKLPDGKILIPGIIDNSTNIIEHPETVAERFVRYAGLVGRENVMGAQDCGFGYNPNAHDVVPSIAWEKFRSLAQGAALASKRTWTRSSAKSTASTRAKSKSSAAAKKTTTKKTTTKKTTTARRVKPAAKRKATASKR